MARPGQDIVPKDDVPWYLKYGGRLLGIVAAFCKYKMSEKLKQHRKDCFLVLVKRGGCVVSNRKVIIDQLPSYGNCCCD